VLPHDRVLKDVWGPPYVGQAHDVRLYMAQLRRKLEANAARPHYRLTEPGLGYRLAAE
jgi:two-component system KDP operon response regulator KdpE